MIAPRYDHLNNKPNEVSSQLWNMCNHKNIPYVDHFETIELESRLSESMLQKYVVSKQRWNHNFYK